MKNRKELDTAVIKFMKDNELSHLNVACHFSTEQMAKGESGSYVIDLTGENQAIVVNHDNL